MMMFRIPATRSLWPVVVTVFLSMASWHAFGATDDFNDLNDDGWFRYNPINTGSWTFPNGAYRIQSSVAPSPSTQGPGRAGSFTNVGLAAFYVAADIVTWDNSLNQVFGLSARISNPGFTTTQGYGFVYNTRGGGGSGQIGIIRVTSELQVVALGSSNLALSPNQRYRFVFSGAPGKLSGQVFAITNLTVPIGIANASDTTYTSGSVGFFGYDNSSGSAGRMDVTIDNMEFKELQPPLTITRDRTTHYVQLSWPSWASDFRLERTTQLETSVPSPWENLGVFDPVGDQVIVSDDTADESRSQAFYRLAKP